jgi:hypothetical protein
MKYLVEVEVSECIIPACGDHPDLLGYMIGPDDGKSTLFRTPEEAIKKTFPGVTVTAEQVTQLK